MRSFSLFHNFYFPTVNTAFTSNPHYLLHQNRLFPNPTPTFSHRANQPQILHKNMASRLTPSLRLSKMAAPPLLRQSMRSFQASSRLLETPSAALPLRRPVGAFRGGYVTFSLKPSEWYLICLEGATLGHVALHML